MEQKIRQLTIVAQVMEEIRLLISSGEYKAGDKFLTEMELSNKFGIGRSSIREALKVFNYMGVLESKPALGTFISDTSKIAEYMLTWSIILCQNDISDIIDMRAAIELWGMILLMEQCRQNEEYFKQTIAELETVIDKMGRACSTESRDGLVELDYEFHYRIIRGSNNQLLNAVYEVMKGFMYEEIKRAQDQYTDMRLLIKNHIKIVEGIKSLDISKAVETHTEHILETKKSMQTEG